MIGNDDDCIGIFDPPSFPELQNLLGQPAPFLPVIIRAVMCHDHFHPQQPRKRDHQGRAYGMDMHYVCPHTFSINHGEESMYKGFKTLGRGIINILYFYAFIYIDRVPPGYEFFAPDDDNLMSGICNARIQRFTMRLYTALDAGYPPQSCDYDFHLSNASFNSIDKGLPAMRRSLLATTHFNGAEMCFFITGEAVPTIQQFLGQ